ncbi:MAG: hypothetical protein ACW99Q_01460 [Candidatus Kariarchaeaceae archaeon]|jgi:hypothetical protein
MKLTKFIPVLLLLLAFSMLNVPSDIRQKNSEDMNSDYELDETLSNVDLEKSSAISNSLEQEYVDDLPNLEDQNEFQITNEEIVKSNSNQDIENNENIQNQPTWLDLARGAISGLSATGTLQVNTQVGSTILQNTPIEIRNATDHIVDSGMSDVFGNYTTTLNNETYNVIVQQNNNITIPVTVAASSTTTVTANFGYINITTFDNANLTVNAQIELRKSLDSSLQVSGVQTVGGTITLTVAPLVYEVKGVYNSDTKTITKLVNAGETTYTKIIFGTLTGAQGGLYVRSNGFIGMPLSSTVYIYNYTTGLYLTSGSTSATTGIFFDNLAPDVYRIEIIESNNIVYQAVQIDAGLQTNLIPQFGNLILYQDNTTNTRVDLYDAANSTRIRYDYMDSVGKLVYTLVPGDYVAWYSGATYPITVVAGNRTLVNSQRNVAVNVPNPNAKPTYVFASPVRINANETTNLTVIVTDANYDYKNLTFTWIPNVGTITGQNTWNRFTYENQYSSTVTYNAPLSDQTMFIDVLVEDGYGGNFTYRLYVSNRVSTIHVNSTQLNGNPLPSSTRVYLYDYYSNLQVTNTWVNASGWINNGFSNILEGEYYLRAVEDNNQYSAPFFLNGSEIYFHNFKWGLVHINSTGLNRQLIDSTIYVYELDRTTYLSSGITLTSGNGYFDFYLGEGNYSFTALERNYNWKDIEVREHQEVFYEFQFGVIAVYYLDVFNQPQSTRIWVSNGTDGTPIFNAYSSAQGLLVAILSPYHNYTIQVDNGTDDYWYFNINLTANAGLNVGQFINHAPILMVANSLPKVNTNGSVIILVTATDPDPLDILTYIYTPSMGTIIGSGSSVNYTAPSINGFYYLNISVHDNHGVYANNETRSLSTRSGTVTASLSGNNDDPYYTRVYLYDWTTGVSYTNGWTNSLTGNITFSNVPENFYYIQARGHTYWNSKIFVAGPDDDPHTEVFKFVSLFVNATGGQGQLIDTWTEIHYDNVYQSGLYTLTSGNGLIQYYLRPDLYDLKGLEVNDLWFRSINLTAMEGQSLNLTFSWAELNITSRTTGNMPLNSRIYLYNQSYQSYTNNWAAITTGNLVWFVRPEIDYQVRVVASNSMLISNITGTAGVVTQVNANFGTLRVTNTDVTGIPNNIGIYVYTSPGNIYETSGSTGTDGAVFFHLTPGQYNINNGSYYWDNISINSLYLTHLGPNSVNNIPSIYAVTAGRIGPNENTSIILEASDIDFDYGTFSVTTSINLGSIDVGYAGWTQTDRWRYTLTYFAPGNLDLYQINLTLHDGRGQSIDYMLHVSNGQGKLNVWTLGNALRPIQSSSVYVYAVNSGSTIISGVTNASGMYSTILYDDLYHIRVTYVNEIWERYVWIKEGNVVNATFLWGEITVYVTGVNDVPLQSVRVYAYNQTTLIAQTNAYTDVEGKVHFILAPGEYRILIDPSSPIIFDNIMIEGGSGVSFGSAVPLITGPSDFSYEEGSTGHEVLWTLTDGNPDKYYITLDGTTIVNSTLWTSGQTIQFPVDGLGIGLHILVIYANDTGGLIQTDVVFITVYSDLAPPFVSLPGPITFYEGTTNNLLTYNLVDSNPDQYILYRDGLVVSSGPWSLGNLNFNLDSLLIGQYQFQLFVNDTLGNNVTSGITLVTVNQPVLNPNAPTSIIISNPPDQSMHSNEVSGKTVEWTVSFVNGIGQTWKLLIDGNLFQQASVANNTAYSFLLSNLNLQPGLHRLTFIVSVTDSSDDTVSAQNIVYVTIIKVQSLPAGTTDVEVGGISNTTINLTVDTPVDLTVEALSEPTSETSTAFQVLQSSEGAINTGYFLEITISNESAIQSAWINISYAEWDLVRLGIEDESSLRIYYYDDDAKDWVPAGNTGVDIVDKIIWANVNHFSAYAAVAFIPDDPIPTSTISKTIITAIETSTESETQGLPAFEVVYALLSLLVLVSISISKKRR